MRAIEFRAIWNKTGEVMDDQAYIGQCFTWMSEGQDITIEQFTGLLDKNGTKIFEGDKVKSKPRGAKMYGDFNVIYDKSYCSFVCHHIEWCDFTINPHENYPLGECRFDIEIIGNIHEAK
jgi:uncharacterized phage protein (TIGR01671 family)